MRYVLTLESKNKHELLIYKIKPETFVSESVSGLFVIGLKFFVVVLKFYCCGLKSYFIQD